MDNDSKETGWSKPGFIVAGSAKCGTTSVFHYASQHPEICLPRKETFYFISGICTSANRDDPLFRKRVVPTLGEYKSLFSDCAADAVAGEIATGYLYYHEHAIPEIKKVLGDPRIVIILRNPVERAWSGYMHLMKTRVSTASLEDHLQKEAYYRQNRFDFMWYLADLGMYYQQVAAYLDNFSNVKIMLFDDLKDNASAFMQDFFEFVGVNPDFIPDTSLRHNTAGIPSKKFHKSFLYRSQVKGTLRKLARLLFSETAFRKIRKFIRDSSLDEMPEMSPAQREALLSIFREDIIALQSLADIDLNGWLDGTR